jgi:transglutaminase-like putative cysteine protease
MKAILCFLLAALSGVTAAPAPKQILPPGDNAPPTVFERIKKVGTSKEYENSPYLLVLDSAMNRVDSLGIIRTDTYVLYKVLNDEGCRQLAVLSWGYEPLSSFVDIRSVSVIRGDSQLTVPVADVKDLPAPQSMIYWGNRLKLLQLPRLQVGDGIEVRSFRKGYSYALLDHPAEPQDDKYIPPMRGEYFDIILFEATVPIIEKIYVLSLPPGKRLHSQIYNGPMYSGTTYLGDTTYYSWWAKNMPAWSPSRSEPDESDILTKVVLATAESWEAKSRWFFEVNEPQFTASDAIKQKVSEILSAAGVASGSEEQKAFELVHWVAQNIRYSGQSMGTGEGYTLHSGAMIFEQRSGVCKDIAGMLITMMRAAGLNAHPAMTMAGSRIEDLPADQFNHCVVALRKSDGSYEMYDPTWVPNYKDIWSKSESEQHYLIGSETGEHLSRIRYSPPDESPMKVTNTARILSDGTLEGTFDFQSDGSMDSRLRRIFVGSRKTELRNALASMLRAISDRVEVTSIEHGDALDFKKAMWWSVGYRIPEYSLRVDSAYEFKSPMMQLTTNSGTIFSPGTYDWPEKRHDDLFFYTTQLLDASETITLLSGYRVTSPKNGQKVDETYASFAGSSEMTGSILKVSQKVEVRRRQIPPDGYAGFRRAIKEARTYAGTLYRAEKGAAR